MLRPLPEPMLARAGPLPTRGHWAFEVKWDGFRALVRTGSDFRVRSRRDWDMSALVPELRALPTGCVFDGELVAFVDGLPRFDAVCARLLHGHADIVLTYVVFDLLAADGEALVDRPYVERRERLEALTLPMGALVADRFDDGAALWDAVVERGLEGVVGKRLSSRYVPGDRSGAWVKRKNRETWSRCDIERERRDREPTQASDLGQRPELVERS